MEINLKYGYQQIINDSFEEVERRAQHVLSEVGFGVLTKVNVKETIKEKLDVEFKKYTILKTLIRFITRLIHNLNHKHQLSL